MAGVFGSGAYAFPISMSGETYNHGGGLEMGKTESGPAKSKSVHTSKTGLYRHVTAAQRDGPRCQCFGTIGSLPKLRRADLACIAGHPH